MVTSLGTSITHLQDLRVNTHKATINVLAATADRHTNLLRNIEPSNARHRLANAIVFAKQMVDGATTSSSSSFELVGRPQRNQEIPLKYL
ncbi:hypothetical protein TSUD_33030 [Trifolium subterraneum]|uniref:Uncharacterized protein n=1 Tax=Trifolium subterraneum TaxID=3900 RepID=A0A2Z6LPL6_TRISU|nr:hypothetical protein TSUD_33030 [Trifolium subterraneum]